ncbi:MAG TPA: M3 family oligoendopeptidase [Candidatus Margulisiibacteriota bacterium]|nr:M3 family oligoendopeptidase [Candidatus Margulisiibacteriota bacterium]
MIGPDTARGIAWDLADLFSGVDDPLIVTSLDAALEAAKGFGQRYRGQIHVEGGPAAATVVAAVKEMEVILERAAKASAYADLVHAADTTPPQHGALVALTQERSSAIRQEVLFFELEWLALDDAVAQRVVEEPQCRKYRHFLRSLRRYRPHVLSEPEEKILEDKANTGARALSRLFDELVSSLTFDVDIDGTPRQLNESGVLTLLYDPRREVRRGAAAALTRGLQANELVLGFIFNTLVQDHAVDDRLRRFGDPMQARHLANEINADTVQALLLACEARHDLVERYYRLKSRLLGLDRLADYDRYAPVVADEATLSWARCREVVLAAYGAFAPRMQEIAAEFFAKRWIDAEARQGKRGGAFSASTVPSVHPYLLVNYTGRLHDVMTVAHELGHGVHQYLSRPQGYLQADTPLTMAETASVFGEMLVFEHLLREVTDPRARLGMLCNKIEDTIATVFRQATLTRFEQRLHAARRREGELSRERICTLWQSANAALYGDAVTLTDDYRWWWAYIPHFVHSPFYCYAYSFGDLLVLALYEQYRRAGEAFVPAYLDLLAAGGSDTPESLLRPLGIAIEDPRFWQLGLEPFSKMVEEAERLAG